MKNFIKKLRLLLFNFILIVFKKILKSNLNRFFVSPLQGANPFNKLFHTYTLTDSFWTYLFYEDEVTSNFFNSRVVFDSNKSVKKFSDAY